MKVLWLIARFVFWKLKVARLRRKNTVLRRRYLMATDTAWPCEPLSDPCPSYGEDGDIHGR